MPLMSVIVPIYKVAPYLKQCVESISSQTLSDIEIILVDDESPDESPKICDELAQLDSRIQVVHQKNAGVSVARNTGLECATADWVMFVDGDDWLEPNGLEILYSATNKIHCDIIVGSYFTNFPAKQEGEFGHYSNRIYTCTGEDIRLNLLSQVLTCRPMDEKGDVKMSSAISYPWGSIYRRGYLEDHDIRFVPGLKRMQDTIFNLYAVHYATTVLYVDQPLYHYRKHEMSVCSRLFTNQTDIYGQIIDQINKFMQVFGRSEGLQQAYYMRILGMCSELCHLLANSSITYEEQTQILKQFIERYECKQAVEGISRHELTQKQQILWFFYRQRWYGLLLRLCGIYTDIFVKNP